MREQARGSWKPLSSSYGRQGSVKMYSNGGGFDGVPTGL
jgi:hypothetical protein